LFLLVNERKNAIIFDQKPKKNCIFAVGKSSTTSSCWIPQAGNGARVSGWAVRWR